MYVRSRTVAGTDRRDFLRLALAGGLGLWLWPGCREPQTPSETTPPPQLSDFFDDPVRLKGGEIIQYEEDGQAYAFLRLQADSGAQGVIYLHDLPVAAQARIRQALLPAWVGQDLRTLPELMAKVTPGPAATYLELAVLDLLGNMAGQPAAAFFGRLERKQVPVYLDPVDRGEAPEAFLAAVQQQLAGTGIQTLVVDLHDPQRQTAAFLAAAQGLLEPGGRLLVRLGALSPELGDMLMEAGIAGLILPDTSAPTFPLALPLSLETDSLAPAKVQPAGPQWLLDPLRQGGMHQAVTQLRATQAAEATAGIAQPYAGPLQAVLLHLAALDAGPHLMAVPYRPAEVLRDRFYPSLSPEGGLVTVPAGAGWGLGYDTRIWLEGRPV